MSTAFQVRPLTALWLSFAASLAVAEAAPDAVGNGAGWDEMTLQFPQKDPSGSTTGVTVTLAYSQATRRYAMSVSLDAYGRTYELNKDNSPEFARIDVSLYGYACVQMPANGASGDIVVALPYNPANASSQYWQTVKFTIRNLHYGTPDHTTNTLPYTGRPWTRCLP